jgi:signal transduction histidine kinase
MARSRALDSRTDATKTKRGTVPKAPDDEPDVFFRISAGLKRLIGRDLIIDEFVAIFELVKNSFDAGARRVTLLFTDSRLFVIDNGKGMSRKDILEKWLFVAYSAKRDGSEDQDAETEDYRDRIRTIKVYAGSKGVGRFSCDRLGRRLTLQTHTRGRRDVVEMLEVDWDLFEQDDKEEFGEIPVRLTTGRGFTLPAKVKVPASGTVLEIRELRQPWDREKLLALKYALAKLINPFGAATDKFEVVIQAPDELDEDKQQTGGASPFDRAGIAEDVYHRVVNGVVKNFIFDTLRDKTTHLDVTISPAGDAIESALTDRGELIYRISEANPYSRLGRAEFKCQLFYLNQSAKMTFARRMGVPSVQFGSVFLFRNGFRVFPIGEEGDDSFSIDRRKQQGFRRFLGTRDIIGRIDVTGSGSDFEEATSRDQGLIRTVAYMELEECFREKCLKRLERYVVDISWKDRADKDFSDISRLRGDKASARITGLVARLANAEGVTLLEYSPNLVRILNEKSEDFAASLAALRVVAERTRDRGLLAELERTEARYRELQRAEAEARAQAERERAAREQAENEARAAAQAQHRAETAYEEEKKRSLFLASIASVDHDTIVNLHHQIVIYAAEIHHNINNQLDKLRHGESLSKDDLVSVFERIDFKAQQILAVSRFASKANFRLDAEQIDEDIASFIVEYLEQVAPLYAGDRMTIQTRSTARGLKRRFKPIEISMLLDNLISNSKKAGAMAVDFELTQPNANELRLTTTDNGFGLDPTILEPDRIFEKGFTTTKGSGLGLYYVRFILDQMRGTIEIDPVHRDGARFIVRIFK